MEIRPLTCAVFRWDGEDDIFCCIVKADGGIDAANKYAKYIYGSANIQIDDFGCNDSGTSEFLIHASMDVTGDLRTFVGPKVQKQERIRIKYPTVIE